jgi:hypothetical protein
LSECVIDREGAVAELEQMFAPLLDCAEKDQLFFYSRFEFFDLWLSPSEFRSHLKNGSDWIQRKWTLRDPLVRVSELEKDISLLQEELKCIKCAMVELRMAVPEVCTQKSQLAMKEV